MLALLAGLIVYWVLLHASHIRMREQVTANTQRLAGQTAEALALQMNTAVRTLDFFTQHLSWLWLQNDLAAFDKAALTAISTLPPNAVIHVAVTDATGKIVYSSFEGGRGTKQSGLPVTIADREHFQVHANADGPLFFISEPIMARISNRHTVQLTRGIWDGEHFRGILVMAVSAEYLATALKAIFPDSTDAASLVNERGVYLSRSYYLDDVLGAALPAERPFIQHPELLAGHYEATAAIDNVRRLYNWRRVDDYPLIILVGLGADKAMALTNKAIRDSHWQSGLGSGLLFLAGLLTTLLWVQRSMRATELVRIAEALHTNVQLRRALLDHSAAAIVLLDKHGRIVEANAQFCTVFLKPGQQLQTLELRRIHIDQEHWERFEQSAAKIRTAGSRRMTYPFRNANGEIRWFDTHAVLEDPENPESNIIWTWIDITSQHEADAALAVETLRLNTLLDCYPGGVLIEDANDTVVFVNDQWPQLLRLNMPAEDLRGMHDSELRASVGPVVSSWLRSHRPHHSAESRRSHEVVTADDGHLEIDHVEIRQNHDYLGSVWLVRDITKRKKHELELARLATTDPLTGLPNRRSFMEQLNTTYEAASTDPKNGSVVMILDLDHFKRVNDTYGHDIGDIVLQHIAQEMTRALRDRDVPGRLGGEEFAILLPHTSLEDGLKIAERVRHNIEHATIDARGHQRQVTISIGVAIVSALHTPDVALNHADQALYLAKSSGRNRVCTWRDANQHD